MHHVFQSVPSGLLYQCMMLRTIAKDIERQIFPPPADALQLIQHDIIALLMIEVAHGCNIDLVGIHCKINGDLHFSKISAVLIRLGMAVTRAFRIPVFFRNAQ